MSVLGPGKEFDLIRRLLDSEGALPSWVRVGPGDDCAGIRDGLLLSTDLTVEGVHFRREWVSLEEAGYRAVAAALSDLAAMAAQPLGILLSMAICAERAGEEAPRVQSGAKAACAREGIPILGGDLSSSPGPLVLDVVVVGRGEDPLLRSGGRPGHEVWVTGWLGGSAASVRLWNRGREPEEELRRRFARPEPRIRELRWLRERVPLGAGIDLSDGLAGDAGHLAAASGVQITLDVTALPGHPSIPEELLGPDGVQDLVLRGGEDYEVCFTAPDGTVQEHEAAFQEAFGIPLTRVGWVEGGSGVRILDAKGNPIPSSGGFDHFQEGAGE